MNTLSEFLQETYGWSKEQADWQAERLQQPLEGEELERKLVIAVQFMSWLSEREKQAA